MTLYDSFKGRKRKKLMYGGDWTELGQGNGIQLNKPAHSPHAYAPAGGYKSPAQVNAMNYSQPDINAEGATGMTGDQIGAGVTGAFSLAQAFMTDSRPRGYYEESGGEKRTNEGLKYGAQGASLGATVGGPIGAVIGGAVGMAGGYFKGKADEKKHNAEVGKRQSLFKKSERLQMQGNRNDQGFGTGNRGNQFYKYGGSLHDNFAKSKDMESMSSHSVDVKGAPHSQGGVDVPGTNANVEKGETIANDYVFSKELGFAKLHRPVAKAIGKIEEKPATRERVNSLRLLREREERLKRQQESVKERLNLQ